jgi:PEP-CTERM motif
MTSQKFLIGLLGSTALVAVSIASTDANAAACSTPYVKGDVFAATGAGTYDVFTPAGALVCTLDDGQHTYTATGSGFDAAGNFYVTNFSANTVSKFNNSGGLVATTFMSTSGLAQTESIDNQSKGFYAGMSVVGGPRAPTIDTFNTATGALIHAYSVLGGNSTNGSDWVDTYNPTTGQVIYDGEGQAIRSAILNSNGTVTQLTDFNAGKTGQLDYIYALRTIPSGSLAGDVLAANSINAVLLDASGNVIKTYTLPGNGGGDFALNLDPNGMDFWTGDYSTSNVWEVNIATGAIDQQWNTGAGASTLYGISVFGEIQSGGGTVPEPASLALLGSGLAAFGLARRRRKAV